MSCAQIRSSEPRVPEPGQRHRATPAITGGGPTESHWEIKEPCKNNNNLHSLHFSCGQIYHLAVLELRQEDSKFQASLGSIASLRHHIVVKVLSRGELWLIESMCFRKEECFLVEGNLPCFKGHFRVGGIAQWLEH